MTFEHNKPLVGTLRACAPQFNRYKSKMKNLYSPQNDSELAIIRSIFDGEGLNYYIRNDHFGSLKVGPKIDLLNAKMIQAHEEQFELASDLISEFLENSQKDINSDSRYTVFDKIRMIIETLIFGWFMPGRFRKNSDFDK